MSQEDGSELGDLEQQVFTLVAQGLSKGEVAAKLEIAGRRVEQIISSLRARPSLRSKARAVAENLRTHFDK